MSQQHDVDSEESYKFFVADCWHRLKTKGFCSYRWSQGRTAQQNSALHLWFNQIAIILNDHGISQKAVLEAFKNADIPNTQESVKENYRVIMRAMTGKESTTEQSTVDPSEVAEQMMRFFAERLDVVIPDFPRREK